MTTKKPLNILVTGGGGFLGSAIVKKLLDRGDTVTIFARGDYPEMVSLGAKQFRGDITDRDAVTRACGGMDMVFHTAAKPGVWGPHEDYYATNVTGTENIISACVENNVEFLVHTSSPSVVFDGGDMEGIDESAPYPETYHASYPETKADAEKRVINAASDTLKTIILRPHLIWGPGDNHLVPRIIARAKRLARVGDGSNLVDTIYIDNAADAHILAGDSLMKNPGLSGRVYFISQDEPIPLWDMVDSILEAGGLPPVTKSVSPSFARRMGIFIEGAYRFFRIEKEPPMTRFVAEELATSHWFDISAAKNDLGYRPEVSTGEGLARLKEWLDENTKLSYCGSRS